VLGEGLLGLDIIASPRQGTRAVSFFLKQSLRKAQEKPMVNPVPETALQQQHTDP